MPESLSNDAEMNAHRAEVDQMEAVDLAMVVSSTKSSTEYSTLKEHTNLLSEVLPTARDIVKKLESDAGLKKLWLKKVHIAWILGSLFQESKLDPTAKSASGAYWLAQWTGDRLKILKKLKNYSSVNVQVSFLIKELKNADIRGSKKLGRGEKVQKKFFRKTTIKEVTEFFSNHFERPSQPEMEKRLSFAKHFLSVI